MNELTAFVPLILLVAIVLPICFALIARDERKYK